MDYRDDGIRMTGRYARQIVMPEIGESGQARLATARILVVGAGGLGCPVLQYLAAAGIGQLTVIDHDLVEESNLQRQPLYAMSDVGSPKVVAARTALQRMNPGLTVEALVQRLTPSNAAALVAAADIVVDAADSLAVTYTLSDACMALHTPLVSASAVGLAGYVGAFCAGAPSYRAVFPDMPTHAASCSSAGVLGSLVGMLGCLQAQYVLQLMLGIAPSPLGRLLSFDARRMAFGGFDFHDASEPEDQPLRFIDISDITPDDLVVDLRRLDEAPTSPLANAFRFTPESIDAFNAGHPPSERRIVLCCQSGMRAWRTGRHMQSHGYARLALLALAGTSS